MKVMIDDVDVGENKETTLQVVANHEGFIYDLFQKREEEEVVGAAYEFVTDIVERCGG